MPIIDGSFQIPFAAPEHQKLLSAFQDRLKLSNQALSGRLTQWAENEDMMKAYMPTSENDALRKTERKAGKPQYTTIEIPESYATMLAAHTYLASVFLSRQPVIQMQGRHGESQQAEQGLEALLDYQVGTGGAIPALYIWLLDAVKYGQGVLGHYWDEELITSTQMVDEPVTFLGVPLPGAPMKKKLKTVQTRGYVGARHYNVRPQDFGFDPRVPLRRFQEGEFCWRFDQISWNRVVEKQAAKQYFNIKHIKETGGISSVMRDTGSSRSTLPGETFLDANLSYGDGKHPGRINIHEFFFELVPAEYGLSPSKLPEKWVFTVANEKVIVAAQPLGLLHNKFPFDVIEYEIGGYELFNRSLLEISKPLNEVLTWLFNSHFFNVRKTLNDQFFVDPSMVVMQDMEDPNPGRLVRLKPAAYGKDVRSFVAQMPTTDVTRSHMADAEAVRQLSQRMSGVTDNIMGMVNQGGRKTATEVRSSGSFAANRLKTTVEWMSACGWSPWAQKLTQMTQQMYDMERKYRIVGDLSQWGERYMDVTPEQIAGFYDFVPVDGSLPVDRFAQANLWQQIMAGMQQMPQVAMAYDLPKIFAYVAQLAGLKNITQFRIQVVPDAVARQNAQLGNTVPITPGNAAEPGQVPGMGPTG